VTPFLPARRGGLVPRASWAGAAALTLSFLFGSSAVHAAPPPANTVIGNQASASYLDPNGASQLATSNLVQTTVQQVGSFTLDGKSTDTMDVVNNKTGAAGATVYAPHVLTNTGNGADTFTINVTDPGAFSKVEIFADANADGLPDSTAALCTAVPTGTGTACPYTTPSVAGGNGTFPFVVAYSIPSTANDTSFPSPQAATVNAKPAATSTVPYANPSASDKDNVNLTTNAAFNATKSLSVPAVSWVDGGPWPTASTSGKASLSTCPATVAGADAPAADCTYTTYTLRFNNTGGAAGRFVMTDALPSGFTYVPGSAVWSSAPGTALGDNSGATAGTGTDDPTGIDFAASGSTLSFVVKSLPVNATQTVSFVVRVDSDAAIGTSTTTNTAKYDPLAVPDTVTSASPGTPGSSTNPAAFNVLGTYAIVLGSASGNTTDSVDSSGVPNITAADTTTIASATAGSTIKFTQKAFNTGNASDIVNLSASTAADPNVSPPASGANAFPAGTTFTFYAADGATPLIDNNADGVVDTGPIAAGGSTTFVLAATLPSPATLPTGPFSAIVTGTSVGDSSKSEKTRDVLTKMVGTLVDLTNTNGGNGTAGNTGNGDVGTGPSPNPTTTLSTAAGTAAVFELFIMNNDSVGTTYSLAASQTNSFPGSLPAGWTVKFVLFSQDCSAPEFNSHVLNPNEVRSLKACVTPPASQVPVTAQKIYFQVRSTTPTSSGAVAIDTKTDAVTVTAPNTFSATLTPNNNGQVAPGGSVVYAHTLTNTGGQSCAGPYTVTASLTDTAGWTTSLYNDVNGDGQIDAGDTLITGSIPGPLPAGGTRKLLLKVFAPGGATAGATNTATVTVTFPAGSESCGTPSATDVTTVITGQIRLVKTQALDTNCDGIEVPVLSAPLTAKPGECLVYRVVATNEGASPVTNLTINDVVPAYTSLTGTVQPAAPCTSTGVTPAFTIADFTTPSASSVKCGTTTNTVNPSGTATMTFSVRVNN
jgi:uncharacterized repeat protein (TIGR01451 family)